MIFLFSKSPPLPPLAMPYDPSFPADGVLIESLPFRDQFHGIKDLIDAIVTLTAAQVDGVTTLDPGNPANAAVSVVGNTLHLTFGIPRGYDGAQGANGADGAPGAQGPQGLPGEVSQTDLNNGLLNTLNQTSNNTNALATLDNPFADPDVEILRQKVNELINALRR
jgi:hypothetical protein